MVANLHWGSDDRSTLFFCAGSSLYAVERKTRGRNEPFMVPKPSSSTTVASGVSAPAPQTQAGEPALVIDPRRTALIIQDRQDDGIVDGGGALVLHVWFVCEPGHAAPGLNAPVFEGLMQANGLVRAT